MHLGSHIDTWLDFSSNLMTRENHFKLNSVMSLLTDVNVFSISASTLVEAIPVEMICERGGCELPRKEGSPLWHGWSEVHTLLAPTCSGLQNSRRDFSQVVALATTGVELFVPFVETPVSRL